MTEPVRRRHPRLAVWQGRLGEYSPPLVCLAVAVVSGFVGNWNAIPGWILAGSIALIYQRRLGNAWSWGWRSGQEETLGKVMPHVVIDGSNISELRDAVVSKGPTWRQYQDELSQIDVKATMKARMEQLEQMLADMEEDGPK